MAAAYEQTGYLSDLQRAIRLAEEAAAATPADHPHSGRHLAHLAGHWKAFHDRTGALEDLQKSIQYAKATIAAAPDSDPARFLYINNLACCMNIKFFQTSALEDIQDAVSYARATFEAVPQTHRLRDDCLSNLALYLGTLSGFLNKRYERTGLVEDLEAAILHAKESVAVTPPADPDRGNRLHKLSIALSARYTRTRVLEDLHDSITYLEEALSTSNPTNPMHPHYLNSLALQFGSRYDRTRAVEDLQQAIQYANAALQNLPPADPAGAVYMSNLSTILRAGERHTGPVQHLQQAIIHKALSATTHLTDDIRAQSLHTLAMNLVARYTRTAVVADLQQAISHLEELLTFLPPDHAKQPTVTDALASLLFRRFMHTTDPADMAASIAYYDTAWSFAAAPPLSRISIALRLCDIFHYCPDSPVTRAIVASVLEGSILRLNAVLEEAILLLPMVSPRSLKRSDQQHLLAQLNGLAGDAAGVALAAGRTAYEALRLLEISRGVITGFAIDTRGDLGELAVASPRLFAVFEEQRGVLNRITLETGDGVMAAGWAGRGEVAMAGRQAREKSGEEIEATIAEIRRLPGFEGFQRPPGAEELMGMAAAGPIVVVNSTGIRSDAIIVTTNGITAIPLPGLLDHEIPARLGGIAKLAVGSVKTSAARNEKMRELLRWLWDVAVEPVIVALQLNPLARDEDMPHVWWIGVGAMSTAPFHAAGDYAPRADSASNTMSYCVSSYIPTIKALSYAREKDFTLLAQSADTTGKLLLVTMAQTPGTPKPKDLPGVDAEVAQIMAATTGRIETEHLPYPSTQDILSRLQHSSCGIVHFACHGVSDREDPSNSHLILVDDGQQDRLTVRAISATNTGAQLAYLSACSTADNSVRALADETIHIASGFQLAGFNHVVAAMWPSESVVCVEVATEFYRALCDGGEGEKGHAKVRVALHRAVRSARDKYRRTPARWAQFVHLGA